MLSKILFFMTMVTAAFAADHPTHNMILLGSEEVFASHIVYKAPHNYQVILKLNFDSSSKEIYQKALVDFPNNLQIFLIDHMPIKDIKTANAISGSLLTESPDGKRQALKQHITLTRSQFDIIYFDEL